MYGMKVEDIWSTVVVSSRFVIAIVSLRRDLLPS